MLLLKITGFIMAAGSRRRYDADDGADDFVVRKRSGGNKMLPVWLAVGGGLAFLLLTCSCGIGVVSVIAVSLQESRPDEFVGSWKGRFNLRGQQLDIVYTFDKTGNFREDDFNLQGGLVHASGGRWRFRDGRLEIDWDNGAIETADAIFIDNNTINYRIVDHSERAQIGTGTTFRRH
jgi:hypothetical protein